MTWVTDSSLSLYEDESLSASLTSLGLFVSTVYFVCVLAGMYVFVSHVPAEARGSPGDPVIHGCELQNMVAGNRTQISCKEQTML